MKKYIAVDIGGTSIKYGIVRADGEILEKHKCSTGENISGEKLMEKIAYIIKELISKKYTIKGIGISSAGQIDNEKGEVVFATDNLYEWTGMKIKENINNKFNLPIYVDNDVNCAALAEKWLGAAKNVSDYLCLTIGTGIGGAIIINDQIYRGHRGLAGEWGHMIVNKDGLSCNCGKKGCLESYASTRSLIQYVREKTDGNHNTVDGKNIFKQAQSGNPICQEAINRFVDYLGLGIANLVQVFNPSLVVVGGAITAQGKPLLQKINDRVQYYIMPSFADDLKIELSCSGNYAGMLGSVYGLRNEEESNCTE